MNDTIEEMKCRAKYVKGLRDLAEMLESEPDIILPVEQDFYAYTMEKDVFKRGVKAIGLRGRKVLENDQWANYIVQFGPIKYRLYIDRGQVCERIVVGKKAVAEVVIPAHDEDVVDWKCEPWLGGDNGNG